MPPCQNVLKLKIRRTNFITQIIKNCDKNLIEFDEPCNHGWFQDGNQYNIRFFEGQQFPDDVPDNIFEDIDECDATDDELGFETDMSESDEEIHDTDFGDFGY